VQRVRLGGDSGEVKLAGGDHLSSPSYFAPARSEWLAVVALIFGFRDEIKELITEQ
jgi:hypothetical protein